MVEARPSPEIALKITPDQVWQQFQIFGEKAVKGFSTEEEGMKAYLSFLGSATEFFNYPETKKTNTRPVRELMDKLFYHHRDSAAMPVNFFIEAGQKVKKDILDSGLIDSGYRRFKDEVDLMGKLLHREYGAVARGLKSEEGDRKAMEGYALEVPQHELEGARFDVIKTQDIGKTVKSKALEYLKNDPQLSEDIDRRDAYVRTIAELLETPVDEKTLREKLAVFSEYTQGTDAELYDDLALHINLGHSKYVQERLRQLLESAQDPDFVWQQWVKQGKLPARLFESFEEITTLAELGELNQKLEGLSKETKSYVLLPYLQKGIGASLLREMVEGRFVFSEDLITQEVATFLDFYDHWDKENIKPHKQKTGGRMAGSLLAAALIAMPFIYQADKAIYHSPHQIVDAVIKQIPEDELESLIDMEDEESLPTGVVTPGLGGVAISSGTGAEQSGGNPFRMTSGFNKPENNSPEQLLEAQKTTLWELEGQDLLGFYRTGTASFFDTYQKGWVTEKNYLQNSRAIFASGESIKLTGQMKIGSQVIEIPSRINYAPVKESINVSGIQPSFGSFQAVDGTYFLYFNNNDVGKDVTVSFSLGKINGSIIPRPNQRELTEMQQKVINISDLPEGDLKKMMEELHSDSSISPAVKAKAIEKFMQENFTYSLNPDWSNDYHSQTDSRGFFRRIAELRRVDCDVANTLLVMLLRAQGIPSRMVYGEAHTGGFLNNDVNKMTAAEGHGWAEAYIGGHWLSLDGTPSEMDEYTKQALDGKLSPSQLRRLKEGEDFAKKITSLQDFFDENPYMKWILLVLVLSEASLLARELAAKANNKMADLLIQEVANRTSAYMGGQDYWGVGQTLATREKKRINESRIYGFNPFAYLPPFGAISLLRAVKEQTEMKKLPYEEGRPISRGSEEPSQLKYLTEVLGFDPVDIKRRLIESAYYGASSQIIHRIGEMTSKLSENNATVPIYRFETHVQNSLSEMGKPSSAESWEEAKRNLSNSLYEEYFTAIDKEDRKLERYARRHNLDFEQSAHMSREDFDLIMAELYRLRLTRWAMGEEFTKAMRSAGVEAE